MNFRRPDGDYVLEADGTFSLREQIERGEKASAVLHDEALSIAFARLESDYLKAWGATNETQTVMRENLWRACQILGDVRRQLMIVAQNGEFAKTELELLNHKFEAV